MRANNCPRKNIIVQYGNNISCAWEWNGKIPGSGACYARKKGI